MTTGLTIARGLALRRLRRAGLPLEDAEDGAQEVLLRLGDRAPTPALAVTLAGFEARTARRRAGRRARADAAGALPDRALGGLDPVERRALADALIALRAGLGDVDRAILDDVISSGGGGTTRSCSGSDATGTM